MDIDVTKHCVLTIILINTKRQLRTFTNQRLGGDSLLVVDRNYQRRNMNGMSVPAWSNQGNQLWLENPWESHVQTIVPCFILWNLFSLGEDWSWNFFLNRQGGRKHEYYVGSKLWCYLPQTNGKIMPFFWWAWRTLRACCLWKEEYEQLLRFLLLRRESQAKFATRRGNLMTGISYIEKRNLPGLRCL